MDGFIQHHHDMIILTAIEGSKRTAHTDMQSLYQSYSRQEWNKTRNKIYERIGHKRYQLPSARSDIITTSGLEGGQSEAVISYSGVKNSVEKLHPHQAVHVTKPRRDIQECNLLKQHAQQVYNTNRQILSSSDDRTRARTTHPLALAFYELEWNETMAHVLSMEDATHYKNMMYLLSSMFTEHISMSTMDTRTQSHSKGGTYAAMFYVDEKVTSKDMNTHCITSCQLKLAYGCLEYYQYITNSHMDTTIQHAFRLGQINTSPRALAGQSNSSRLLCMYLDYMRRSVGYPDNYLNMANDNQSAGGMFATCKPLPDVMTVPLWVYVYYCIRLGCFSMAVTELQSHIDTHFNKSNVNLEDVTIAIHGILKCLDTVSVGTGTGTARDTDMVDVDRLHSLMQCCREYYNKILSPSPDASNGDCCPYLAQICRLLTLTDIDIACDHMKNGAVNFTNTLEDYLWCQLWFIYLSHVVFDGAGADKRRSGSTNSGDSAILVTADQTITPYTEKNFYETVVSCGGQSYFDPEYATPFLYVNVLLVCQRYAEAIAHLWIAGQQFASVQLASVCIHHGVILPHQVISTSGINAGASTGEHRLTAITMLLEWAHPYIKHYFMEISEYILLFYQDAWLHQLIQCNVAPAHVEKLKLQFDQSCMDMWVKYILVVMEKDPNYKNIGLLFNSFHTSIISGDATTPLTTTRSSVYPQKGYVARMVDLAIERLSSMVKHQHNVNDPQIRMKFDSMFFLFVQNQRYGDIAQLLSKNVAHALSSSICVNKPIMNLLITMTNSICNQGVDASANTSNSYWLTKAMEFHQNFIATGSPVVAASITNDTAHTLETLLNVSQCYDLYVKQQYNDIIVCMDNIGLIPKNCSEIAIKGEKYLHINEYLCSVMSDILILTTYAIKGLYELYIHESRGKISGGGMSQR